MRQELEGEQGIAVSLRTVERALEPWRRELRNAALVTVRFEAPPGQRLQADFGQCVVGIAGERVRAFRSAKQDYWLESMEEGFRYWGVCRRRCSAIRGDSYRLREKRCSGLLRPQAGPRSSPQTQP